MSQAGMIGDPVLGEVSGLAPSRCASGRLWVLNDSGNAPAIYAISEKGDLLGTLEIEGATNVDWEDMASFSKDGKNYILIGDIGDNQGSRKDCRLYLVEEPANLSGTMKAKPLAVIPLSYETGPRDVESLAVDVKAEKIYLLSKREKLTTLYELPLLLQSPAAPLVAKKIADMNSLPQPSKEDRDANPAMAPYMGQPTGMDLSTDSCSLAVLTYLDVFLYHRNPEETWAQALSRPPEILPRPHLIQAEAICFSADGKTIFVSTERKFATPMMRYDLVKTEK